MLTATFASLIAAKQLNDRNRQERIESAMPDRSVVQSLADGIRVARMRRVAEIEAQLKADKEQERKDRVEAKLRNERKVIAKLRNERDMLVVNILTSTVTGVRKDGSRYMRAKAGKAAEVKAMQERVEMLNTSVRPKSGYPAPPPRRSDAYPQGGLWAKPAGVDDITIKRGEYNRLVTYTKAVMGAERDCMTIEQGDVGDIVSLQGEMLGGVTREGDAFIALPADPSAVPVTCTTYTGALFIVAQSKRVRNMMAQLSRLAMAIKVLGSETHVRRTGKHCYSRVSDPRQTI